MAAPAKKTEEPIIIDRRLDDCNNGFYGSEGVRIVSRNTERPGTGIRILAVNIDCRHIHLNMLFLPQVLRIVMLKETR